MWGTPDGEKILVAGNEQLQTLYQLSTTLTVSKLESSTSSDGKRTEAKAHNLEIEILGLVGGILPARPLAFTKYIENPFTIYSWGSNSWTSSRGVEERYRQKWRWVTRISKTKRR